MRMTGVAAVLMACAATTAMGMTPPVVDFETMPGQQQATPREGAVVTEQYWSTSGIRFSSQPGSRLVMAKVGAPQAAFAGFEGQPDTPQPGAPVGQYFLTSEGGPDTTPGPYTVEYRHPVQIASGTFMDVTEREAWRAEAFDGQGQSRGQVTIWPTPTQQGAAIGWSLDVGSAVITKVVITFIGTSPAGGVTFAFDNFRGSGAGCAADLNGDGQADFGDYLAFLDAYSRSDLLADVTGDGTVDFSDYLEFMTSYDAGC